MIATRISGLPFEELCAGYFQAKGWRTRLTRLGADGGVDIYLYKAESDTKPLGIIQCKAWNTYKVGVKPIRELYGVMAAEQTPLGIFITSGKFTQEAREFAAGKHVKLMTGDDLLKLISGLPEDKQSSLLNAITKGDYTTPSCPSCGTKMVLRTSSKGGNPGRQFWGCTNFPRCRTTLPYRKAHSSLPSTQAGWRG